MVKKLCEAELVRFVALAGDITFDEEAQRGGTPDSSICCEVLRGGPHVYLMLKWSSWQAGLADVCWGCRIPVYRIFFRFISTNVNLGRKSQSEHSKSLAMSLTNSCTILLCSILDFKIINWKMQLYFNGDTSELSGQFSGLMSVCERCWMARLKKYLMGKD